MTRTDRPPATVPVDARLGCRERPMAAPKPRLAKTQRGAGLVLFMGLARLAAAQGQTVDEYQVKAAFLYNFAKFVEWPAGEFKSPGDPIVICVLGRNPFGPLLEQAIMGKQIDGRSLLTREVSGIRECGGCNLLFIGASEKKRWP